MTIPFLAVRCNRFPLRAVLIAACGMGLIFVASRAFGATPVGLWYAEGGAAEVQVFPCADEFCGKVVWLRSPLGEDGCELRDDNNPDSTLRGRAIIGLLVLTGLKPVDDVQAAWSGGSIYDPTSGHTYSCMARLDGHDRLFLRGYFGIQLLGRTTTWTRVGATQCHSLDR
jgi:uncharacterized protein (DUF2147 family)